MWLALTSCLALAGCDHRVVEPLIATDDRPPEDGLVVPGPISPGAPAGPAAFPFPTGCPAVPRSPAADRPSASRVTVTDRELQTIRGWGASVVSDTYIDPLVDTSGLTAAQLRDLDRRVFGQARIGLVRVFGPGFGRARLDAPPAERARDRSIAFMRRVAPYGVRFMFTGADAPPALTEGRRLRPGAEAAYAAFVADYLRVARDLGAPFSFAAIANEPENRASRLQISAKQSALVYGALAGEIVRAGLPVGLILGDTTGWGTACRYATAQTASLPLRGAAQAIATHPYFGTTDQARALREQARVSGLELWQTEFGTGCATCPDTGGIHQAVTWSAEIARSLEGGGTSAWFAFRAVADSKHGPGDALLVRDRRNRRRPFYPSARFDVFRQYSNFGPPGSRVLEVKEQVPGVFAVAFRDQDRTSVVLTNAARTGSRRVALDLGRGSGRLLARRTAGGAGFKALRPSRYPGRSIAVALPADSVTTLTLTRAPPTAP